VLARDMRVSEPDLIPLYRTGVNYPKWGKNVNLGGNEGSINI
jgi:hypothetical protein